MRNPIFVIVKTELMRRRMYMIWWSLGVIALVALTVLAYGGIKGQATQLDKAFGGLTSNISGFVGTSDMFSPIGYLNSQLYYITLPIVFIILGVTLVGSLISKEETSRTLELLLARPLSRTSLLLAKAMTATTIMFVIGIVSALTTILCGAIINLGVPTAHIALATLMIVIFSGAFGAVAFALYAASRFTRRIAAPTAVLLSLGSYIIASLGNMVHGLSGFAKLFPYHYYNSGDILNGNVSSQLVIYLAAMYVLSLAIGIIGFRRRDIG